MLVRFIVENFLSFNGQTEFSMVAGRYRSLNHHIIKGVGKNDLNLLRAAVLYGANASGKSNLIKAMEFGKRLVIMGTKINELIPVRPFKLLGENDQKLSKLQYDFKYKNKLYSYGYSFDRHKIHEEWLYESGKISEKLLFERKTDEKNKVHVKFAKKYIREKKEFLSFVAEGTRPNQLFLTESVQRNINYFIDVYEWFNARLMIIFPESQLSDLEFLLMQEQKDLKKIYLDYLHSFDTGISNLLTVVQELDKTDIPPEIKEQLAKIISKNTTAIVKGKKPGNERYNVRRGKNGELEAIKLCTKHKMIDSGKETTFEISDESDGTQRIIDLIPILSNLAHEEDTYVVDEIDRSLHPHITTRFLKTFLNDKATNKKQLIVTTHESNLLDFEMVRRDEIWFVQKNVNGESMIYSLEEYKPRYDKDIRKGYLLGRFGAIPHLRNLR